jgi:hypothetical protein
MDEIHKHLDFACIVDILVFSRSPHEHDQHIRIHFTQLQKYGIVLNHIKCVSVFLKFHFMGTKIHPWVPRPPGLTPGLSPSKVGQ